MVYHADYLSLRPSLMADGNGNESTSFLLFLVFLMILTVKYVQRTKKKCQFFINEIKSLVSLVCLWQKQCFRC